MSAVVRIDPKTAQFRDDFGAHRATLPGAGLGWLDERRTQAMANFALVGVPHRRVEAWKYTDVAQAIEDYLQPATRHSGPIDAALLANPFAVSSGATLTLVEIGRAHV